MNITVIEEKTSTTDKREIFYAKQRLMEMPTVEDVFNTVPGSFTPDAYYTFAVTGSDRFADYEKTIVMGHTENGEQVVFGTSSETFLSDLFEIMEIFPNEPIVIKREESRNYKGKYYYRAILASR